VRKIKKIITAINNPNLNNKLKMENSIEIVCKDLQYKDAIIDILNENNNVDIIIINSEIPSEINDDELIKKIKEKNEQIRIIYILEKINKNLQEILVKNNINEIYFNNEINIKKIIEIINYEKNNKINYENNKELNSNEEIKKELFELKKIIFENKNNNLKSNDFKEEKNSNNTFKNKLNNKNNLFLKVKNNIIKKINNNKLIAENNNKKNYNINKIITISGPPNVGKTNFIINFFKIIKNKKILIIDFDLNKKDIKYFFGIKKCYKINRKIKREKNNNFFNKIKFNYRNKLNNILENNYSKDIIFNNFNKINLEKNVDLISIKELIKNNFNINFDYLEFSNFIQDFFDKEKNNYDLILIDLGSENNPQINNLIFEKSDINILLTEGNLIGINKLKLYLNKF